MSKLSIYDIAYSYIKLYCNGEHLAFEDKKKIIMEIYGLLYQKWTAEEIIRQFNMYKLKYPDDRMNVAEYFSALRPSKINLMNPENFYYHSQLRITTGAPVVEFDLNTGEMVRMTEPYFLEMRASYTIEELTDYFMSKQCLYCKEIADMSRIKGSLQWLLKSFDLDVLLFMLDVANDKLMNDDEKVLKNPVGVKDYYEETMDIYRHKINQSKWEKDDRVVPKKRACS